MSDKSMPKKNTACLLATIILLSFGSTLAQIPTGADPPSVRSVVPVRVDKAPELDGTLKDTAWQDGSLISSFHQREPLERQPATQKAEVRVLYDSHFLYFGIHCFDSE